MTKKAKIYKDNQSATDISIISTKLEGGYRKQFRVKYKRIGATYSNDVNFTIYVDPFSNCQVSTIANGAALAVIPQQVFDKVYAEFMGGGNANSILKSTLMFDIHHQYKKVLVKRFKDLNKPTILYTKIYTNKTTSKMCTILVDLDGRD